MKERRLWDNSRHFLNVRPVYALGQLLLENLPLFVCYAITRGVTEVAFRFSPIQRKALEANIGQVLRATRPDLSPEAVEREARRGAHRTFMNRGSWFADLSVMAGNREFESTMKFAMEGDWDAFTRERERGRGIILASAHLGNWHGGGVAVGRLGIPVRTVAYRNHAELTMDTRIARRGNVGHIFVDGDPFSTMEIIRALRKGEVVAMLADRPWDSRWIEVPFFGRPSRFPLGPFRIARLADAPIFPAFCTYRRAREYTATICDPIEVRGDDPVQAEREAAEAMARVLERFVAPNLHTWFTFTHVWDTP